MVTYAGGGADRPGPRHRQLHELTEQLSRRGLSEIRRRPSSASSVAQSERHHEAGGALPGALRHAFAQPHRGERRFDQVRGPQVLPVVGRIVEVTRAVDPGRRSARRRPSDTWPRRRA